VAAPVEGVGEGLSEDVLTGLSRFSYLRVIARGSTAKYSSESGDIRAIGKELGARYVWKAACGRREASCGWRFSCNAPTGAHLWAENYERTFSPEDILRCRRSCPTNRLNVADQRGRFARRISEELRSKNEETDPA